MLKKILSSGSSGPGRAALDFAMEKEIPHGLGIEALGGKDEAGSHGMLLVTRGADIGGAAREWNQAVERGRPSLHINLEETNVFAAAARVNRWLSGNAIEILVVTGDPETEPTDLYRECFNLFKVIYHLNLITSSMSHPSRAAPDLPQTVDEAVRHLESRLKLRDKVNLARMGSEELPALFPSLGEYIMTRVGLGLENRELMQSCRLGSGEDLTKEEASFYILTQLWKWLKRQYGLKIVK